MALVDLPHTNFRPLQPDEKAQVGDYYLLYTKYLILEDTQYVKASEMVVEPGKIWRDMGKEVNKMTQTEEKFHSLANAMQFLRDEAEDMNSDLKRNMFIDIIFAAVDNNSYGRVLRAPDFRKFLEFMGYDS